MAAKVAGELSQRALGGDRPVAETAAHDDVVLDRFGYRASHDPLLGHGSATSRSASTLTAA